MLSATKFKTWCKKKGLTASEVAQRLGVSMSAVYKYWQGLSKPSRRIEKRIAAEFDIDTKEMFNY